MNHPKKLLYIGAWDHISPVMHFPKTKEFIFIDTQPRSDFDNKTIFYTCVYRHRFYKKIINMCSQYGFTLLSTTILDKNYDKTLILDTTYDDNVLTKYKINPTLLYFVNPVTNQTIKYYISTNIEFNMCDVLKKDIQQCNGLIICGYFPDKILFNYLNTNKFYCYSSTCYDHDPEYNNSNIIGSLYTTLYTNIFDITFIIIDRTSGKRLHMCKTIQEVHSFLHEKII